jgi:CRISPR-associated protein Cas2
MMAEHLYLVTYDISDQKRWRRVFNVMNGYGEWLQLSVFQCRLSRRRHAELIALLDGIIHHDQDHILFVDVGPAELVDPRVVSLGKDFAPVSRQAIIV